MFDSDWQAKRSGQGSHEPLIGVRFLSTQVMVHMQHYQADPQISRKPVKYVQENNGICAARYGQADAIAGGHHAITRDGFRYPLD